MKTNLEDVFKAIKNERKYQDELLKDTYFEDNRLRKGSVCLDFWEVK